MNDKARHCVQPVYANLEKLPRLRPVLRLSKRPQRETLSSKSSPFILSCESRRLVSSSPINGKMQIETNQNNNKFSDYRKEYTQLEFNVTTQSNKNNNNTKIAVTDASNSSNNEHMMTNNEENKKFNTCYNTDEELCKHNNCSNTDKINKAEKNEMNSNESEELLLWLYASKGRETSLKYEGEREKEIPLLEEEQEEYNEQEEQCEVEYKRSIELFDIKENQSSSANSHLILPRIFNATSSSIIYSRSVMQELENTLKRSTQHETRILRAAKQAVEKEREEEMELLHNQNKQSKTGAEVTKQSNPENIVQETLSLLAQLENRCDKPNESITITGAKEVEASYNYGESKKSTNLENKTNVCDSENKSDKVNYDNDDGESYRIAPAFANLRVEPLTVENLRRRYGECDVLYAMRHKTRNAMTTLSMPSTASLLEKESVKHLPLCSVKSNVTINKNKEKGKLFPETTATHTCKVSDSNNTSKNLTKWQKQAKACDAATISSLRERVQFAPTRKLHIQQTEKKLYVNSEDKVAIDSNIKQTKVKNSNVCNWSNNSNNKSSNVQGKYKNNSHTYNRSNVERTELDGDKKPWWATEKFRFHLIRQWCDRTQLLPQFTCSKNKCNAETESPDDAAKKEVEQLDPEKAAEITMLRVLAEEIEVKTNRMLEQKRALRKDNLYSSVENENYLEEYTIQSVLRPSERNAQLCAKSTLKTGLASFTNSKQNHESAIDLTSANTCNTSKDAWWTREFEPWKDVNVFNVRSANTLRHNHRNQHKELQQEEEEQQLQQYEQKVIAWNKEWYSAYLSCCECQLLEMLTITHNCTFKWMKSKQQKEQEELSSFGGHVNNSTNAKSKVWKKQQNEQGLHEVKLILTFASSLSDLDKTILHVDLSELLYLTPASLLDKWSKRKLTNAASNIDDNNDDKDDDNEKVTLRADIEKWRYNLYSLYTRAVYDINYSCDSMNSVNCNVSSDKSLQEEHTQYLCCVAFDITSFVDASVHCITETERQAIELIKESEVSDKLKCITVSPTPQSAELELNVNTEKDTLLQSSPSAHQDMTTQTQNTNGDDSVVAQDDTLITLPHAPLHGRRRYPIDMRQLFVTASLCKQENENILFAELRKLKATMQVARTQLINLCKEHEREQEWEEDAKPFNANQMSLHMCEQNQKLLQRTKYEWRLICELQNTELEYVHVMHKVCENELLIIKYNYHVEAFNSFARQEQPLWGKLYKTGLLISYALCLYLHRHGMDELPEKYFVLLPQVARFLNCVGGHREMRLRLPQLLIEINERAKKVRLHLDYVMECWIKNNNSCTCNEWRECVILDAVICAAAEIKDDPCTHNYEGSCTNNNHNYIIKKNANYMDQVTNSINLHNSANAVGRFISCLATEDDVVTACMQPLSLSSVRLESVLHD